MLKLRNCGEILISWPTSSPQAFTPLTASTFLTDNQTGPYTYLSTQYANANNNTTTSSSSSSSLMEYLLICGAEIERGQGKQNTPGSPQDGEILSMWIASRNIGCFID